MIRSCEAQTKRKRIDAVLDAAARPGMRRMTKKIRTKRTLRKLECKALKSHDSWVNKRVKSSAERMSNACRTRAE
jgi:hypothetical protein